MLHEEYGGHTSIPICGKNHAMKRLLFMGGADIQVDAICKAKDMGYEVITCDFLPDNPGHRHSHHYFNVSTTEKDSVLELARHLKIDGISAYASDPAAPAAAYVAEALRLPGNPYQSINILSNKLLFRAQQWRLGIPSPAFADGNDVATAMRLLDEVGKVVVKPVDSSGSKGVHIVERVEGASSALESAIQDARGFSRLGSVIVEQFIPRIGSLMSGDFLIQQGKVVFQCYGDVHFNDWINGLVPRSISLPASKSPEFFDKVRQQAQTLITSLNIRQGVFNTDVIEDASGNPVIIDIGARNGGNLLNNIIHFHTGVDLVELSLRQCAGDAIQVPEHHRPSGCYAHNVIHSEEEGTFDSITFSSEIKPLVIHSLISKKPGDRVRRFISSAYRVGLILLKFDSVEQMHRILGDIRSHVKVNVRKPQ